MQSANDVFLTLLIAQHEQSGQDINLLSARF